MKNLLLLLLLVLTGNNSFAQYHIESHITFDLRKNEVIPIVPIGKQGVLVTRTSQTEEGSEALYIKYDTNFMYVDSARVNYKYSKEFVKPSPYINGIKLIRAQGIQGNTESHLHNLMIDKDGNFIFFSLEYSSLQLTTAKGKLLAKVDYGQTQIYSIKGYTQLFPQIPTMKVIGDYAYFMGVRKDGHFLMIVNWRTGESKAVSVQIPGYKVKAIEIMEFQVMEEEILVFVKGVGKKEVQTLVIAFDMQGKEVSRIKLPFSDKRHGEHILACRLEKGHYIISGTYTQEDSNFSVGIFCSEMNKGELSLFKEHSLLKLNSFISTLPLEGDMAYIERGLKKQEKTGEEFFFDYPIVIHPPILMNDEFFFLGEAYHITYKTVVDQHWSQGQSQSTERTVFDGNQFDRAIMIKFDKDGEIVWEKSLDMWEGFKSNTTTSTIKVSAVADSVFRMSTVSNQKLIAKSILPQGKVFHERKIELERMWASEWLSGKKSTIVYWYDNIWLASSYEVEQKLSSINFKSLNIAKVKLVY